MRRAAEREKHWKEMVDEEHIAVTSIAWYLQVELLRTKQVPEYTTMTTIIGECPVHLLDGFR